MKQYNRETFRILRQYESVSLVRDKYLCRHSLKSVNQDKIQSIVFNMKQARGLFESATNSDYLTRPTEQYYGILAYSRAMMMFLERGLSESALSESHGLKIIPSLPKKISNFRDILNINIKVEGGFFKQWVKQSHAKFAMRADSNVPAFFTSYDESLDDLECSFAALLSLLPDLWSELKQLTGDNYIYLKPSRDQKDRNKINLSIAGSLDADALTQYISECFLGIDTARIHKDNERQWVVDLPVEEQNRMNLQLIQSNNDVFNAGIGTVLIMPPIGTKSLSPMAAMMMVAYVMSRLARYRPSIWGKIWHVGGVDSAFPLMEQAMDLIQDYFPTLLVDNMDRID